MALHRRSACGIAGLVAFTLSVAPMPSMAQIDGPDASVPPPTLNPARSPSPTPSAAPSLPLPSTAGIILTIATTVEGPGLFDRDILNAPAGKRITVRYENQVPIPHNIAFFAGDSIDDPLLARTQVAGGPGVQEMSFQAPAEPGAFLFACQVHPTAMTGALITS